MPRPKFSYLPLLLTSIACFVAAGTLTYTFIPFSSPKPSAPAAITTPTPTPFSSPKPSAPAATPTLSPAERQAKYGPCVSVHVLMYHHIADEATAKSGNYGSLNVTPENFSTQMQYLADHHYTVIPVTTLASFFATGTPLPTKPVILTFDDAYEDFATVAAPILESFSFPSTLFVPTGLVDNPPRYALWSELASLSPHLFYFGNHTWSHKAASNNLATQTYEITTADTQLRDHGMNADKVFAYPYGAPSAVDQQVLASLSYSLAFTTTPGTWQCKGQRYTLPRTRIGNAPLSAYGM